MISAIIFTQGCNFKCPYCHNPELLLPRPLRETKRTAETLEACEPVGAGTSERVGVRGVLDFLKTRIGKLDGVVITGGEPTLHKDLPEFINKIKDLGFAVKLDTNGTNPQMLDKLIQEKLIDYVAMDIKAPIGQYSDKYSEVTCSKVNPDDILKSIEILKNSDIDFEFRTTVVKSQLTQEDFESIGELIKGAKKYYLQKFVPSKTLNKTFMNQTTYTDEEFIPIIKALKKNIANVELR